MKTTKKVSDYPKLMGIQLSEPKELLKRLCYQNSRKYCDNLSLLIYELGHSRQWLTVTKFQI